MFYLNAKNIDWGVNKALL